MRNLNVFSNVHLDRFSINGPGFSAVFTGGELGFPGDVLSFILTDEFIGHEIKICGEDAGVFNMGLASGDVVINMGAIESHIFSDKTDVPFNLNRHGVLIKGGKLSVDSVFLADDHHIADSFKIFTIIFPVGLIGENGKFIS